MCYKLIDEKSVFANNELSLRDIAVYGFDYDYTLAHYTDELNSLIYQMSLEKLIKEYSVSRRLTKIPHQEGSELGRLSMKILKFRPLKYGISSHFWRVIL
jgi:hypothetical protein